jgi:2,3-bisphosphoglycerate-dependent phosphoglycerate mutase
VAGEASLPAYRQGPYQPPAGAVELLLVRHGQSQPYVHGSPFPLVDGQGDPPLSDQGLEQAERVCARLAREDISAILVTPLRRTGQTAAPLAAQVGIVPQVEAGLREVHLGEWEGGLLRKMVADQDPVAQRMLAEERWDVIPGAESSQALSGRVQAAIDRLASGHAGHRVVAFTHGGIVAQALALATSSRPFAFAGADNASISRLVLTADRWILRGFNDTAHLAG